MMPTGQVVQKYDQLHHSLLHMLELKKTVDKLEAEHRARVQRGQIARVSGQRAVYRLLTRLVLEAAARWTSGQATQTRIDWACVTGNRWGMLNWKNKQFPLLFFVFSLCSLSLCESWKRTSDVARPGL